MEGGGFAIEFDENTLDELMKVESEKFAFASMKSDDVHYDKFETLFDSKLYEGVAGEMIWQVFDEGNIDVSEVSGRKNIEQVILNFVHTAPFLKHWGFQEEREYRLVGACNRPHQIPEGENRAAKEIRFRTRNSSIVPYIELFKALERSLPIKAIIIGPHPHQEKRAEAVKMLLETRKFEAEIRLSEIPFRT